MLTINEKYNYIISNLSISRIKMVLEDHDYKEGEDDDSMNPWMHNREKINGKVRRLDGSGIQILSLAMEGVFSQDRAPTSDITRLLETFLEDLIGNISLSRTMMNALACALDLSNSIIIPAVMGQVISFVHSTRRIKDLPEIEKLRIMYQALTEGSDINVAEKFSRSEFSAVSDLSRIFNILDKLSSFGLIEVKS